MFYLSVPIPFKFNLTPTADSGANVLFPPGYEFLAQTLFNSFKGTVQRMLKLPFQQADHGIRVSLALLLDLKNVFIFFHTAPLKSRLLDTFL